MSVRSVLFAASAVVAAILAWFAMRYFTPRPEITPFAAPKLTDLAEFSGKYKNTMLWGTYRSGLYFGLRTRVPQSLLVGLIWFDPDSVDTLYHTQFRHDASQGDKLDRYGWIRHDGLSYGRQVLIDRGYNISIAFVKDSSNLSGVGGDWAVRVSVEPVRSVRRSTNRVSLIMYIADEANPVGPWQINEEGEFESMVSLVSGSNSALGPWSLHLGSSSGDSDEAMPLHFCGIHLDEDSAYSHLSDLAFKLVADTVQKTGSQDDLHMELPDLIMEDTNAAFFQVTPNLPATFDLVFISGADQQHISEKEERLEQLSGARLTQLLQRKEEEYDRRFEATFLGPKPGGEASPQLDESTIEVAKAAVSNLMGSMGYFWGSSLVQLEPGTIQPSFLAPLFTCVPSRSFFPRGFLWDEGFHQLLVQRWQPQVSRDVIAHWLDLMNAQGWIAREQILGLEARKRVPQEFLVQHPSHANPPSLFLPIANMARQLAMGKSSGASDAELAANRAFLQRAWPRLAAWFRWFNTTQAGELPTTYRWHGRTAEGSREINPKTLMSGLDDYPRPSHPSEVERHLDLRCWMALASRAMSTIAASLDLPPAVVQSYQHTADSLSDLKQLNKLHLDPVTGWYLDWGNHTEDVELKPFKYFDGQQQQEVMLRNTRSPPKLQFVPSYGYVALFPLLMKLLPADSAELGRQLQALQREELLWSSHGLRSLATSSSLYNKYNTRDDPPYWRGQVWVNINYLALAALHHYAHTPGPHAPIAAALYAELRTNLLKTLVQQYNSAGYLFERYSDQDGRGLSSHPFTGWTALVTLIATETY